MKLADAHHYRRRLLLLLLLLRQHQQPTLVQRTRYLHQRMKPSPLAPSLRECVHKLFVLNLLHLLACMLCMLPATDHHRGTTE